MQFAERTRSPELQKAFERILPKLEQVERSLAVHLDSPVATMAELGRYVLKAGGKRIRPALLLVVSNVLGYEGDLDVAYATVVEYIHTATLVHDDVIDEAKLRRGRPSANAEWGNLRTVLFGDFLYARALKLVLDVGDLRVLRCLNDTILRMIEGELLAVEVQGRVDLSSEEYFEIVRRKTGVLFGATCEIPSLIAPGGSRHTERLREYGQTLGAAFQVVDDLFDYSASVETLGKPVLSDLREGKVTLPLILALPDATAAERKAVETVLEERDFRSVSRETILEIVDHHGTLGRTQALAQELADRARELVSPLPDGEAKDALLFAPDFILNRNL